MDTRNDNLYVSKEAALLAGVPEEYVKPVEDGQIVRVTSGPFKGRVYRKTASGWARVREPQTVRA